METRARNRTKTSPKSPPNPRRSRYRYRIGKTAAPDIVRKTLHAIERFELLKPGEKVLVAVSGGPDSMALLDVLQTLASEFELKLTVFHLNHLIRGPEADADEAFVRNECEKRGLPVITRRIDVRADRQPGESLEEAARRIRYRQLKQVAEEAGADKVALGHHADDQVETFVMRVMRGAGLEGLTAIPPRRGIFIRPLIEVTRQEIEAYCDSSGISFVLDQTNFEPVALRNRVRQEVLPAIDRIAPGWRKGVAEMLELLRDDALHLRMEANRLAGQTMREAKDEIRLAVSDIEQAPKALKGRLLRIAAERISRGASSLESRHIRTLLSRLEKAGNFSLDFPGGLVVSREYVDLAFAYRHEEPGAVSEELPVPGVLEIRQRKLIIESRIYEAEKVIEFPFRCSICANGGRQSEFEAAHLDLDRLEFPLVVRDWRPGDRLKPLGLDGTKKVHDYLIDRKVPLRLRRSALILESNGRVAWIVGGAIGEWAKVSPTTRQLLHLSVLKG